MKKTFTINISGAIFHIDEDAYDKLREYLAAINNHFGGTEEGAEIAGDIEARVAELFREKMKDGDEVVSLEWVEEVIGTMGTPQDFMEEEEEVSDAHRSRTRSRKLYRDPDSRVLGGVCSGMGAYFKIDPVVLRILFVGLFLISASTFFLVYVLLWIVVPKAGTISQRLEMRGEDINISNIERTIRDEYDAVKNKFKDFKNSSGYAKGKDRMHKAGDAAQSGLHLLLKLFVVIVGAVLIIIGVTSLVGMAIGMITTKTALVMPSWFGADNVFPTFVNYFISGGDMVWIFLTSSLVAGIPLLMLIFIGSKLMFKYKTNNALIGLSALGVWIISLITLVSLSLGQVKNFKDEASQSTSKVLEVSSDTLYLKMADEQYDNYRDVEIEFDDFRLVADGDNRVLIGEPRLDIESSSAENFALQLKYKARGRDNGEARESLDQIKYNYQVQGNTIFFDHDFSITEKGKWRDQSLKLILKVPEGKVIYLDDEMNDIIYNIDNVSNMWDGDMVGKYWMMMPEGLTHYEDGKLKK